MAEEGRKGGGGKEGRWGAAAEEIKCLVLPIKEFHLKVKNVKGTQIVRKARILEGCSIYYWGLEYPGCGVWWGASMGGGNCEAGKVAGGRAHCSLTGSACVGHAEGQRRGGGRLVARG